MNTYEKVYKAEKRSGNSFVSFLSAFKLPFIAIFILMLSLGFMTDFKAVLSEFGELFLLFVLLFIVLGIASVLAKSTNNVDERFERIHAELGTDPETLNYMLENMTCVNENIFIDNDYYINFGTGKVTKTKDITALKRTNRYSRNATYHAINIEAKGMKNFDYIVYNKAIQRDNVYGMLSIITGIKEDPKSFNFNFPKRFK